jgi:hypothetical protein
VLYLGIVQLGLAYILFTTAMARGVRSLDAGIVGYIEPVLILFGCSWCSVNDRRNGL